MSIVHDNSGRGISQANPLHILENTPASMAVREGRGFVTTHYIPSLAPGASYFLEVRTGANIVVVVGRNLSADGSVQIRLWESPTFTPSVTEVDLPPTQVNRLLSNQSLAKVYTNPTGVTGGTLVSSNRLFTGGMNQLIQSSAQGGVLKPNTSYITQFTNDHNSNVKISWEVLFYEQAIT